MRCLKAIVSFGIACLLCASCSRVRSTAPTYNERVEVAPGQWLALDLSCSPADAGSKEEWSALEFVWNGQIVRWRGPEIPFCLREHEGTLYMAGFNRVELPKCRLVFFKLLDNGRGFAEIRPGGFPPSIATQNMWLSPEARHERVHVTAEKKTYDVDTWAMLRTLNISSPGFYSSLTAKMWFTIETGTPYDSISAAHLNEQFLSNFVSTRQPVAVPTIVEETVEKRTGGDAQ